MLFETREQAGKLLAKRLKKYAKNSLVLAIPRGGVVVGSEVAKELRCPLNVIITRKLGAPGNPELAIGATTSKGGLVLDRELIDKLGIKQDYIYTEHLRQLEEARRREKLYLPAGRQGVKEPADMIGKTVILVDDGIATGATVEAAVHVIREELAEKIVIAVPVAPPDTVERLKREVDDFVALSTPDPFYAIGEFYSSFPQISDEEVVRILEKNKGVEQ